MVGTHPEGSSTLAHSKLTLRARFFGRFEVLCDEEPLSMGRIGKSLATLWVLCASKRSWSSILDG